MAIELELVARYFRLWETWAVMRCRAPSVKIIKLQQDVFDAHQRIQIADKIVGSVCHVSVYISLKNTLQHSV